MISVSFSDVLKIDEFKHLKEIDLLQVSYDAKVLPYLFQLGMDIQQGYQVIAKKHRNLQNNVITGFLYSGEIRLDQEFKHSPFCSVTDRLIMSSKKDFSLTQELCQLQGGGLNYSKFSVADDDTKDDDYLMLDLYEPDYQEVSCYLDSLENIIYQVRGSPNGDSGALKTYEEYLNEHIT